MLIILVLRHSENQPLNSTLVDANVLLVAHRILSLYSLLSKRVPIRFFGIQDLAYSKPEIRDFRWEKERDSELKL